MFITKYKIINSTITDFTSVAKVMEGYAGRLNKVKSAICMTGLPDNLSNRVGSRAVVVNTLSIQVTGINKCFEKIGNVYLNGEQEVHRRFNGNRSLVNGRTISAGNLQLKFRTPWIGIISAGVVIGNVVIPGGWPKINWDRFRGLWENLKERNRNNPVVIDKEKEKADDLRMKNEVQTLLGKYENAWRKATTDAEKKKLLNSFLSDIQNVMGTSAKSKISFRSLRARPPYVAYGSYTPLTKRVTLNKDLLSKPEGIYLLTVLIHEVRHAYQHEAAKSKKHEVSDETRHIWKENLKRKNYKTEKRDGFDAYYNQPVERDARWFSGERVL